MVTWDAHLYLRGVKICGLTIFDCPRFDDIEEYRNLGESDDVWIHLDAAYAGPSWILPHVPTPPLEVLFDQQKRSIVPCGMPTRVCLGEWRLCGNGICCNLSRWRSFLTNKKGLLSISW